MNSDTDTAASNRSTEPAPLALTGVWAGYGERTVLSDVSFSLRPGTLTGLIGPNGSGKSTLIKVVLGLLKPWQGRVQVFGEDVDDVRGRIGYMPQIELVDWRFPVTVEDLVTLGRYGRLRRLRPPSAEDRAAVQHALDRVNLWDLRRRQIGELSGGQQRRLLLARALARSAELLLLDEPLAGLDVGAQEDLEQLLRDLVRSGSTLFVATHDLHHVAHSYDEVLCLNGRIVAHGVPDRVLTEDVLQQTFGRQLVLLEIGGKSYGIKQ
ncbi:MAG: metal ABC transporter ATP-binding protein [Dehalococcoidia bacterium]